MAPSSNPKKTFRAKLSHFVHMPFQNKRNALHYLWRRFVGALYYRQIFASFGYGSVLYRPLFVANAQFIHIGKNVQIRQGVRLEGILTDSATTPELRIGDNVVIEQNVHITFHRCITIEDKVSIAPMCTITDTTHPFDDVGNAQFGALVRHDDATVVIGEGTFIGAGTVVLPNVILGARCVIGANSVVTRNMPPRSVAAGSPARVLRSVR